MMDNNKYEVGVTPDDNNNTRLPGTVNPEPTMGGYPSNYAKQTALGAADTGGVVGMPTFDSSGMGQEGYMHPSQNANVDVHNSDTSLMATVGDSEMNLSKKYKYPNVTQDVPPLGRPSTTYSDHT